MTPEDDSKYLVINPLNINDLWRISRRNYKLIASICLVATILGSLYVGSINTYYRGSLVLKSIGLPANETLIVLKDFENIFEPTYASQDLFVISKEASEDGLKVLSVHSSLTSDGLITITYEAIPNSAINLLIDSTFSFLKHSRFVKQTIQRQKTALDSTINIVDFEIQGLEQIKNEIEKEPNNLRTFLDPLSSFQYDIPIQLVELKKQKYAAREKLSLLETPFLKVNNGVKSQYQTVKPNRLKIMLIVFLGSLVFGIFIAIFTDKSSI